MLSVLPLMVAKTCTKIIKIWLGRTMQNLVNSKLRSKQGCVLRPILFSAVINKVVKKQRQSWIFNNKKLSNEIDSCGGSIVC